MTASAFKVLLIADSTIDPLARFISQGRGDIEVSVAPYDQVFNTLAGDLTGFAQRRWLPRRARSPWRRQLAPYRRP